ncbi:polyprenol monophosphomannose synthase [Plantibacter sp. YIM 135249]|uniref:polyprenol monophosphomannose synthase n=1 Tax=Plantibacter sp. YIM 135249 TaxID=3423918 RepID=UPI003D337449
MNVQRPIVIIPTYNEVENLRPIVERTLANPGIDILVVDDDSPDGTGRLADELAATEPRIHVFHRAVKDGLGGAYLVGFAWALARGYDAIVEMDADGSHHPEDLPRLLGLLGRHDLALGSRWVPGGEVENWPLHRLLLSRGGNVYTRLALGIGVADATGGFRAFRADALRTIDLDEVSSQGYCFQVDLLWRALQHGLSVVETPITFTERVTGESKMSGGIVTESLCKVTAWGLQRRVRQVRAFLRGRPLPSLRVLSTR